MFNFVNTSKPNINKNLMYAERQQNGKEDSHYWANIPMTLIICCKYLLQIIEFIFVYSKDNL